MGPPVVMFRLWGRRAGGFHPDIAQGHRFAIGAHRAKRSKAVGATPLDDVPGVGATRKRALLTHFGSAKAVSRAALEDLKAVDGISEKIAETIYDYFHEKG